MHSPVYQSDLSLHGNQTQRHFSYPRQHRNPIKTVYSLFIASSPFPFAVLQTVYAYLPTVSIGKCNFFRFPLLFLFCTAGLDFSRKMWYEIFERHERESTRFRKRLPRENCRRLQAIRDGKRGSSLRSGRAEPFQ